MVMRAAAGRSMIWDKAEPPLPDGWFVQTSIEEWLGGIALQRNKDGKVISPWRCDVLRSERDRDAVWKSKDRGWSWGFRPASYIRECRQIDRVSGPGPIARAVAATHKARSA